MTHRTLVLGADGSVGAAAAMAWAVEHAPPLEAEVVVVHSIDVTAAFPAPGVDGGAFLVDDSVRASMRDALVSWCAPLRDAGIAHRTELYEGNVAQALTRVAADCERPTIVVGRRGHGGFAELVLGSVPHALAHHADVPVVIVPA